MDGTTNIIELKGIGEKSATAFGRLGIRDVDSLITMYPKYYLTYEDPKDVNEIEIGQRVSIFVRINSEVHIQYARRMKIVTCTAKDHTGTIMLVWYNMPYLKKQLHQGRDYIFTGTPIYKNGRITMEHPEIFTKEEKREWLDKLTDVTLGSDAFFPFFDNIERAHKSGVKYIAQPGVSVRDDAVIDCCNKYNMAMAFTGIRLFHH